MKQHSKKPAATVVDGNLVLSLPGAKAPVVWRWNLAQAQASSLEISDSAGDNVLRIKSQDGSVQDIARFDTRDDAMDALMVASRGLGGGSSSPLDNAGEATKWIIAIVGTVAVIGLFFYLSTITPKTQTPYVTPDTAAVTGNPSDAPGVPVSADDLLNGIQ